MIDSAVPGDLDLHLVLDNYATHKTPEIHKWLLRHPRFHLHFTSAGSAKAIYDAFYSKADPADRLI